MEQGLPTGAGIAPAMPAGEPSASLAFTPAPARRSDFQESGIQQLAFEKVANRGGQATVVKAKAPDGLPIAVKVFENADDADLEWSTLLKFNDFKVLPKAIAHGSIHEDDGLSPRERPCIVEEWIEGEHLSERMQREGAFTVEGALRALRDVISFLATAEDALRETVVHHDIKPQNIMLDAKDCTRLIDFGVSQSSIGKARCAWGTQAFAAPEWFFSREKAQRGSDSYSVAATFLALLAGKPKPPAYGVVVDNGTLRYDPAWTDERENELMEQSSAPFPGFVRNARARGIYLEESQLASFSHDDKITSRVRLEIGETLLKTYGAHASKRNIDAAAQAALDAFDAKLRTVLGSCLSIEPTDRPSMRQLQNALPRDEQSYVHELRLLGVNAALGGGRILSGDDTPFEGAGTLAQALDDFNAGLYERAIHVFDRLARQGNASAKYYLAICIRDSLGNSERVYNETDLMQMMGESAAQGAIVAQFWLGQALYAGSYSAQGTPHAVEKNPQLGLDYIRRAAEDDAEAGKQGFPPAKAWLKEKALN